MKLQTARKIVAKLINSQSVKLKKGKGNGINEKSYNAITDVLFNDYDVKSITTKYYGDFAIMEIETDFVTVPKKSMIELF